MQMVRRNPAVFLVSAGFLLLAACNPFAAGDEGGELSRAESIIATATARAALPVPTPTATVPVEPTATPLPTATPTPSPTVGRALAESLVWSEVSGCAEQVAAPPEEDEGEEEAAAAVAEAIEVNVVFASAYDAPNLRWLVDIATNDDLLSFGQWTVTDEASPLVTPRDATAGRIAAGDARCALPSALLDGAPTPPLFLAIEVLVPSAELAATRVWTSVYGCYQEFPAFESFAGRAGLEGTWIIEGKSETTRYGLWEVDAATGAITPKDDLARQVDEARQEEGSCSPPEEVQPTVVTSEEASLRAWVAAYDCFEPHPEFDSFTTRQEDPRRWVVEGRLTVETTVGEETIVTTDFYGVWLVDTGTGAVSGLDNRAIALTDNVCFKELP